MTLSEFIKMLGDFLEIAVTVLLAYVIWKIATLIDTINNKISREKTA